MTDITLRSVKGAPLTHAELDQNFEALRNTADSALAGVDGVGGKANASAIGTDSSATSMGTTAGSLLPDNGTAKDWFRELEIFADAANAGESAFLGTNDLSFAPAQHSGITGSILGKGLINAKRTGGYGTYRLLGSELLISAPSNGTGEFDVGLTSWVTHQNLSNNNQLFGAWLGANTPSSALGQTYASGAAVGAEINVGNRWADFGLQTVLGGTRYTVGLQLVPDVIPASDGETAAIYPGTFGLMITKSIHGHKWWTGYFTPYDSIMAAGIGHLEQGGSVVGNAPADWVRLAGYWGDGIDLTGAVFSGAPINLSYAQMHSGTATSGSTPSPGNYQGFIKLVSFEGTVVKIPYYQD